MKTALNILSEQAYFNKWLLDLTQDEVDHVISIMESYASEQLSEQRRKIEELRNKYDNQYKNGREILDFEGVSMSTDKYDSYKSQLQIIHEIKKDLNQILKEE